VRRALLALPKLITAVAQPRSDELSSPSGRYAILSYLDPGSHDVKSVISEVNPLASQQDQTALDDASIDELSLSIFHPKPLASPE
jgi:hypothetical protein